MRRLGEYIDLDAFQERGEFLPALERESSNKRRTRVFPSETPAESRSEDIPGDQSNIARKRRRTGNEVDFACSASDTPASTVEIQGNIFASVASTSFSPTGHDAIDQYRIPEIPTTGQDASADQYVMPAFPFTWHDAMIDQYSIPGIPSTGQDASTDQYGIPAFPSTGHDAMIDQYGIPGIPTTGQSSSTDQYGMPAFPSTGHDAMIDQYGMPAFPSTGNSAMIDQCNAFPIVMNQ
ncbi:hypothetical protein BDV09DRAFT_81717 [Aspergillus tetrazonus]